MYSGPVIDCDVHHARSTDAELIEYLSRGWREYVSDRGPAGNVPLTVQDGFPNPHGFMRADTYPKNGGEPGSDYQTIREQLLDASDVRRVVLTYGDDSHVSGHHNPYFAAELARATNDWSIDRWLSKDDRFVSSILVGAQLPDVAAAEVRRHAANPRMGQVMLVDNPFNYGFGHPVFHPIYAAAEECDRPVAIHGGAGGWANPPSTGGGSVNTYFETHVLWPQAIQTHLVSFIAHGVFEKFPNLRLVLIEGGSAWIPSLLWRFDTEYKGLRREVPWLRHLPSEYFAKHVWVTTQPLEIAPRKEDAAQLLHSMNLEDRLVYSSDYPHWDADEIEYLSTRVPALRLEVRGDHGLGHPQVDCLMPVDVGAVSDFEERRMRIVNADGREVGVLRWHDRFFAMHNRCPHQKGPVCLGIVSGRLSAGAPGSMELDEDTPVIACPWHGWEFELERGRALWDESYAIRTYPVTVRHDRVLVEFGKGAL